MVHFFLKVLNLKGHPKRNAGSRVTVILLIGWILPIDGASAVEGLRSTGLPQLVFKHNFVLNTVYILF